MRKFNWNFMQTS